MKDELTTLDEALRQLTSGIRCIVKTEAVSISAASGRVLASDLFAAINVPPQANSAMDGYAVNSEDVVSIPVTLHVSQRIPAGEVGSPLATKSAARIFTGAQLPLLADAVVMQENTEKLADGVKILQGVEAGENIRQAGEDFKQGELLFHAGHRILPHDIGTLAAAGMSSVKVRRRLKVGVVVTGSELVQPGTLLEAGKIYNSNYYLIQSLLASWQIDCVDYGIVADVYSDTRDTLHRAAEECDCIISSGGVSVGEEDHVKRAIQELGSLEMWKIAIKPGKPFAFGFIADKPFFGVPGNPVSAFVTLVLLVRPALLKLIGASGSELVPHGYLLRTGFEKARSGERQEYLRVCLQRNSDGQHELFPLQNQSSGAGSSVSRADGLAIVPPFTSVDKGDMLSFIPFSELVG